MAPNEFVYVQSVMLLLSQGVTNFVRNKFSHMAQKEWQTMYDLAKMFLHCLNHWKLETPSARQEHTDDVAIYKVNYTRWGQLVSNLQTLLSIWSLSSIIKTKIIIIYNFFYCRFILFFSFCFVDWLFCLCLQVVMLLSRPCILWQFTSLRDHFDLRSHIAALRISHNEEAAAG